MNGRRGLPATCSRRPRSASTIFGSADSYEVITELDPKIEWSPERMLAIQMRTSSGSLVPLGAFARVDRTANETVDSLAVST